MASSEKAFGIIDLAKNPGGQIVPSEQIVPLEIVLELPAPPSINRAGATWRLGNKAPQVLRWRRAADAHLIYTRQNRRLGHMIKGFFACDILWDRSLADELHSDIDNRVKYLLDYLQDLRVVENDRNCRPLHIDYGNAPDGCRVRLRAWHWQS